MVPGAMDARSFVGFAATAARFSGTSRLSRGTGRKFGQHAGRKAGRDDDPEMSARRGEAG